MPEGLDQNGFTPEEAEMVSKIFATSSVEYLATFGEALVLMKEHEYTDTVLEPLHRSIHSLKGASMQLGFLQIGELSMAMEKLIKKARTRDPVSVDYDAMVPLLEAGVNRLREYLARISDNKEVSATSEELIAELEEFNKGLGLDSAE